MKHRARISCGRLSLVLGRTALNIFHDSSTERDWEPRRTGKLNRVISSHKHDNISTVSEFELYRKTFKMIYGVFGKI